MLAGKLATATLEEKPLVIKEMAKKVAKCGADFIGALGYLKALEADSDKIAILGDAVMNLTPTVIGTFESIESGDVLLMHGHITNVPGKILVAADALTSVLSFGTEEI